MSDLQPRIMICHDLPGRLRLRLSMPPHNERRMVSHVKDHEGIDKLDYTALTKSVLVYFDPARVSREEILVRLGVVLSTDYENSPVLVVAKLPIQELSNVSLYSGLILALAFVNKLMRKKQPQTAILDYIAGGSVGLSVLEHGWSEIRKKGVFDPEVLSVTYLLIAMLKGNILPGALFTWIASFGRHLVSSPTNAYELKPLASGKNSGQLEMLISPKAYNPHQQTLLNIIPSLLEYFLMGGKGPSAQILSEMKKVADVHNKVLHGLGSYKGGIPLTFE